MRGGPVFEPGRPLEPGKVWADRRFLRRLIAEPRQALCALGIAIPDGVEVKTVASKGTPSDPGKASLLQFVLTRGPFLSYFFLPSPASLAAQQAAYGKILSKSIDDPAFERRLRSDAEAAIRKICTPLSEPGHEPVMPDQHRG